MKVNLNSKSKIYLIIFVAFAIVVLAASSYAYLINTQGVGDLLEANTTTGNAGAFTMHVYDPCQEEGADPNCVSDTSIDFDVSALQMSQLNVTNEPAETDSQTLIVNLISANTYEGTRCTYDLVWVWDSDDKYTTSDVQLPYTSEDGITYPFEFSVMINDDPSTERDLSSLQWSEDGTTAVLVDNKIITNASVTDKTTQSWKFTVNMYNIEAAQRNLFRKDFKAHIEMQNYECVNESIEDDTIHYLVKTGDNQYTEKKASEIFPVGFKLSSNLDINEDKSYCKRNGWFNHNQLDNTFSTTIAGDECYIYIDSVTNKSLAQAIIDSNTQTVGTGQIVNENGYRFEGQNPNNYVCFGSTATTCPEDNLYRIIGSFNEYNNSSGSMQQSYVVKLVKNIGYNNNATFAFHSSGSTYGSNSNQFQYSYYPSSQVYTTLNTTYYNALAVDYQNMIANSRWWLKTDAATSTTWPYNADQFYSYERNGAVPYGYGNYDTKIGLMYVSDVGYGALVGVCPRNIVMNSFNSGGSGTNQTCATQNWIVNDKAFSNYEWLINRFPYLTNSKYYPHVYMVYHHVSNNYGFLTITTANSAQVIRPSFYLKSNVKVASGSGTSSDPYRLAV